MSRLSDKVSLVTGAALGIGRAVALAFAGEGSSVVLADINEEAIQKTARDIEKLGGKALFVHADVSKAADAEAMVKAGLEHFGKLDVAYVNAAIQPHDQDVTAHLLEEAVWDRVMGINLKGAWLSAKYAVAPMLLQGSGSVIFAGSPTGLTAGGAPNTAYSASKGGIAALTRVMAGEYGKQGIRVNMVVPGPIYTPLTAPIFDQPEIAVRFEHLTLLGRIGQPEEVTGIAVFLASDESSYCTGGFYMVDGGITAL